MKRILLLISTLIISIATAFAADPNPYAYNLKKISYDDNSKTLVIGYSLNAPADSIFVYAEDAGGRKYQLCHLGARGAGDHTESLQLLYADDVDILPRNEQLTWGIAAKGKKYSTHQTCDRKIDSHTPFSISIDRNPNSDYFGRVITTQANNNYSVGLYAYDAGFRGGYYCLDPDPDDVYLGKNQNWYDDTFLTPYRVRIIQDGSGRVLVSSAAVGQPTYLWWVNPDNLNDWRELIQSHIMKEYAPVGLKNKESDSMGNIDFDLQVDGDNLNILLFGSSITTGDQTLTGDALHSGIYTCNLSDLSGGSYRALTEDNRLGGSPHPQITRSNYLSFLNGHTQFDQFGGAWFCGYGVESNQFPESPALVHFIDGDASRAQQYEDNDYIKRKSVGSASICYNKTFDRFAISQGNLANEARIYNVSQAENSHPVLSNGSSIDIFSASGTKYIVDMCWDYADNLYLCVRNRDAALQGVWVIAAALNGDTTSTPAPINKGNEFTMTCRDVQHRVTATSSISMSCKIQNADGTDFVDGWYDECSKITLKAVPSAGYKFLGWKKDGNLVSTDLTYSFYVTQETNIMAMFEYAVYNVEWFGLFQSREDITDYYEGANAEMDKTKNTRLWRLFQVEYNAKETDRTDQGKLGGDYNVAGFLTYSGTLDFMTNTNNPFYWLAKYFTHILGSNTINKFANSAGYNVWGFHLYAFINRTNYSKNSAGTDASSFLSAYPHDFSKFPAAGNPDRWRKFWLKEECGLDTLLSYDKDLPKTWNQRTPPTGSITVSGQGTLKPSDWYKWNNQAANPNKLLAWYYDDKNNPTWPANPTIVRNVYKDGALFATWVDKSISEDEDKQQKNSDVIYLLNHHNGTHNIEVDRTLQANMYNTFCLPFGVNAKSQLPSELQDATFVKFGGVENLYETSGDEVAVLNFSEVTFSGADTLEAGKPYLVLPKKDISTSKVYTNIKTGYKNGDKNNPTVVERAKTVTQETANGGHVSFCGTINSVSIPEQTVILVADSRLAKTTEAGNMLGLRGYFIVDDPYIQSLADDGKLYLSMKKPVTTSIPVAPEAEQQTKPEVRKIMRDGQIYILRGNEVYTITGHRVK